jgi:hypothetical protein
MFWVPWSLGSSELAGSNARCLCIPCKTPLATVPSPPIAVGILWDRSGGNHQCPCHHCLLWGGLRPQEAGTGQGCCPFNRQHPWWSFWHFNVPLLFHLGGLPFLRKSFSKSKPEINFQQWNCSQLKFSKRQNSQIEQIDEVEVGQIE